ncbi:MAG: mandelate racemase/muconate lactonizing enzyme family protein [Bryobacteraceae bacterium]|nr:mandelate racemase/muconate lactonizing enzyme family protein [Bryobacteraceae bacterium]
MTSKERFSRRRLLEKAMAAAGLSAAMKFVDRPANGQPIQAGGVNKYSAPSQLKITDMRAIRIASNFDYPIIRIDTNQGVYGLGEVRDAGNEGTALILKPHLVGRNPLQIEPILDSIRNFANQRRMGGGYSAVDIALHDIAGKVYGVPCWRLIGSKYRDRVRIYCDTDQTADPKVFAARLLRRKKMGYTFFKMDLGTSLVRHIPGAVNSRGVATTKGLQHLCEYLVAVKDAIGWDQPLAADHFGPLDVNDSIRYARAFEPYDLAWMEDPLQVGTLGRGDSPKNWQAYKEICEATTTVINTGESLFGLEEGFRPFIENRAVDMIHPDPLTSGAIRETKRIADYASMFGIPTAVHFAGSPVGCMASVHMIATIKDFVAMENHAVDIPWWDDLVTGLPKPIVQNGYITVPDKPGLGVELNEEVCKQHLRVPGWFEPTPQFDRYIVDEFRRGGPYPHLDAEGKPVVSD